MADKDTLYTLSPSAASRWTACPGCMAVCSRLPTLPETPAAREGTLAHEAATYTLALALQESVGLNPVGAPPEAPEMAILTDEMLDGAQVYADSVLAKLADCGALAGIDEGQVCAEFERKVVYDKPGVKLSGRCDFCLFNSRENGLIVIVDYKFGGSPVPAKDNPQLLSYALCLAEECADTRGGAYPERIIIGIVQPRSAISDFGEHGAMWAEYTWEDFTSVARALVDAARAACNANDWTQRVQGAHCKWCPARSVCRAAIGERLLLAGIAAGEAEMKQDATDEQIGVWLTALKAIEDVRADLVNIAKARIHAGVTIPGWRMQTRRGRAWSQDIRDADGGVEGQAQALAERLGVAPDAFIARSLKSPAQMAKTMPNEALASVTEETATTALVSTGGK